MCLWLGPFLVPTSPLMTAHSLGVPEIGLDNKHAKANHTRHLIQCLVNSQPSGKGSSLEELTLDGILQSEALPGTTVLTAYWNTEGLQATWSPCFLPFPKSSLRAGLAFISDPPTQPCPFPALLQPGPPRVFSWANLGWGQTLQSTWSWKQS